MFPKHIHLLYAFRMKQKKKLHPHFQIFYVYYMHLEFRAS